MLHEITGLIGRDRLLTDIFKRIRSKRNILLYGEAGMGKTAMLIALREAIKKKTDWLVIHLENIAPLQPALTEFCRQLNELGYLHVYELEDKEEGAKSKHDWKKIKRFITRMNIKDKTGLIIRNLNRAKEDHKHIVVFIDHMEAITPSMKAFLLTLSKVAQIVGATQEKKKSGHLKKIWWMFEVHEIPPLEEKHIREIVKRFIARKGLMVEDEQMFISWIIKESKGNPQAVANLLLNYSGEKVIRKSLIRNLKQTPDVNYIDITPLILLMGAGIVSARFVALGMDDKTLYIIAGIGTAIFLAYRFFMYRGMREEREA